MPQDTDKSVSLHRNLGSLSALQKTVRKEDRLAAADLQKQLICDFGCTTRADKMLVDTMVSGYMRYITAARNFNAVLGVNRISPTLSNHLGMLSKEMDRANRNMLTAYQMLVNLKRPPLKVQIKTQNAFIGQNQQFNGNKPEKTV